MQTNRHWDEQLEAECETRIRKLLLAPQASVERKKAFSQLLSITLVHLDRFAKRPFIPEDESASVALNVVARLERENHKNLAEFARRADEERAAGRKPSFEGWLRKLCKWEILNRLNKLSVSGLLPGDQRGVDIIENKAASQSLAIDKMIRVQRQRFEHRLLEEACKHLDERQRTAVVLYWEGKGDATEDGKKREITRAVYENIREALNLKSAHEAREIVRGARQKLDFWLERLMAQEAAGARI